MSVATRAVEPQAEPAPLSYRAYRLTRDRYYRMIEAGIFTAKDPVFLWKGQLVTKMTKNPPHITALTLLYARMVRLVPDGWHVRQDQPVELGDESVPEPDLTVVRGGPRDYAVRQAAPRDVGLLVEVADTSLPLDRGEMLQTYAARSIPVYWILNIPGRCVEVYTQPTGPADQPTYGASRAYGPDEEVPVVLDGREVGRITVRDVLP